jgi:hypothetical protein
MMSANELLPAVQALSRSEQLKLVHAIIDSLAAPDPQLFIPDGEYPIWSQYDSYDAAATLMKLLESPAEAP